MKKILAFMISVGLSAGFAGATLILTEMGTTTYNFSTYNGTAAPTNWVISTPASPNFVGTDTGSSTGGGVRAYTNSTGQSAYGFLGNAGTPLYVTSLVVSNNTGSTITEVNLQFDVLQFRVANGGYTSTVSFADTGVGLDTAQYAATTSPATGLQNPALLRGQYTDSVTGLSIAPNSSFTLTWTYSGNGLGGSGSRQGMAIDNVALTVIPEPTTLAMFGLTGLLMLWRRYFR